MRAQLTAAARPSDAEAGEVASLLAGLRTNVEKIEEHGRRADAIVRAMLLHARGSAGAPEPTDLHLLDETIALVQSGRGLPVAVERTYDPAVGVVAVVRQAVGRAVLNLLDNAFHAVRERAAVGEAGYAPRVTVSTEADDDDLRLVVSDNGDGIPEPMLGRIFEPFFTTKPTGMGTGLGLSLVHDILRSHDGAIAVQSEPGRGTTFTVTLPLRTDREGEG